ncbi:hypothetical protein BH10BAC3_BH10BAC3_28320 [soil metagenome]
MPYIDEKTNRNLMENVFFISVLILYHHLIYVHDIIHTGK